MKIAHINCLLSKNGRLGVEKKLVERAKAVSDLGLDMDIYYFNFARCLQDDGIRFFKRKDGPANRLGSALWRYSCISRQVDADRYDLLVLRYSGGDFSLFSRFLRNNAHKIVTEHQAKELPETYTYKTSRPQKMIAVFMERFLGPKMIRRCAGLIGNCDEVRHYELERSRLSMPSLTLPDGVSVEDTPFSKTAPYKGDVLNLLCLATSFSPWQGLDRVLAGLAAYGGPKPRLHLKVVGEVSPEDLTLAKQLSHRPHVQADFPGRQYGPELEAIFKKTHMAFGPLAMFRKGLEGGSALKTREYMARGLPFVVGHRDPDLQGAGEFLLPVAHDDSPVNMKTVVDFAERILNRPEVSESMRDYARKRLDWKIKMKQMWDFLESVRRSPDAIPH